MAPAHFRAPSISMCAWSGGSSIATAGIELAMLIPAGRTNTPQRLIATVKCGGANQSYLWFTGVHGWNHFNGYLGSKDSGIIRHHC